MPFTPTQARYRAQDGLELREGDGPWLMEDTKTTFLDRGFVLLIDYTGTFTEEVTVPANDEHGAITFTGTTNPVALELARRRSRQEFKAGPNNSWADIPLP